MSLFAELKERRLVQIVAGYAAAGWVVLGGVDQLVDREVLPDFVYLIALVWFVGGLAMALVAGWYHGEKGRQKATTNEIALLVGLGICVLLISGSIVRTNLRGAAGALAAENANQPLSRIAVRYFEDRSRDESLGFVADGLSESLIASLAEVQGLDVVSASGSLQFRDFMIPTDSVGRGLGAGTVVEGSVRPDGDRIRVDISVAEGTTGVEFRRASFERPADELFELQAGLAEEVTRLLRAWLGEEIEVREVGVETDVVAAWATYQRGERSRKLADEAYFADDMDGFIRLAAEADQLFADAADQDPAWARPWVGRAEVGRRQSRAAVGDLLEAQRLIEQTIEYADRAIELDDQAAEAYEHRGYVRYLRWALGLETDPTAADALFDAAEEDLQTAVRIDSSLADAWNTLSIVHAQKPDPVESKIAARRAYEADAFLRSADEVLWGLYTTSYDLEQFPDAVNYCEEGRARFTEDARFWECELWLLASRALQPDVVRAEELADSVLSRTPAQRRAFKEKQAQILIGGVLARADQPDSARAVFLNARATPDIDPTGELQSFEAIFRIQMGDTDEAIDLIRRYLSTNPEHREGWQWSAHWWWRPLMDNQEFQDLVGAGD